MTRVTRTTSRSSRSSSRRKRRRGKGLKVLIMLLALFSSGYAAYQLDVSGYFTISRVETAPGGYVQSAELDSLCRAAFVGRSIFSDLGAPRAELAAHPMIKSVRCMRRFPDCVRVIVREREPVALANTGRLLPVDADGYVLPLDPAEHELNLPLITPGSAGAVVVEEETGRMRLDKRSHRLVQSVLRFREMAPELLPEISEFGLDESGKVTLVTMDEGLRVVMGKWVEPKNIDYLRWMLAELSRRGDNPELVDLSFDGQIIVRNGTR